MLKSWKRRCEELVAHYQPLFDKAKQKTFVTQHTAFFLSGQTLWSQAVRIAGISPEQEPTARQLAEIQQFVRLQGENDLCGKARRQGGR